MTREIQHRKVDVIIEDAAKLLVSERSTKALVDTLWNRGQEELRSGRGIQPKYRGRLKGYNVEVYWFYVHDPVAMPTLLITCSKKLQDLAWQEFISGTEHNVRSLRGEAPINMREAIAQSEAACAAESNKGHN